MARRLTVEEGLLMEFRGARQQSRPWSGQASRECRKLIVVVFPSFRRSLSQQYFVRPSSGKKLWRWSRAGVSFEGAGADFNRPLDAPDDQPVSIRCARYFWVFESDPAAGSYLEVLLCYPGLHALCSTYQ